VVGEEIVLCGGDGGRRACGGGGVMDRRVK